MTTFTCATPHHISLANPSSEDECAILIIPLIWGPKERETPAGNGEVSCVSGGFSFIPRHTHGQRAPEFIEVI